MAAGQVLVVSVDGAIVEGLVAALEGEGYPVSVAMGVTQALLTVHDVAPIVAIIDVGRSERPVALSLLQRLRADGQVPTIILGACGGVEGRLAAFNAGAEDYLDKPFDTAELLARIRVILRRHGGSQSGGWQVKHLRVNQLAHSVSVGGIPIALTATEFELLVVLLRHRGQVLSKDQLLSSARGGDGFDPRVVECHISHLRHKLGPQAHDVIETVRGYGYVIR